MIGTSKTEIYRAYHASGTAISNSQFFLNRKNPNRSTVFYRVAWSAMCYKLCMADEQTQRAEVPPASELEEPIWAVVSFEKIEGMNLTYTEASSKLAELEEQKIPGLCVVTNQAAIRSDPDAADI